VTVDCEWFDAGPALAWIQIFARLDLGWAYPITSLAYPITMIFAAVLFSERYDWQVWAGAMLIAAGAVVLGPPRRSSVVLVDGATCSAELAPYVRAGAVEPDGFFGCVRDADHEDR